VYIGNRQWISLRFGPLALASLLFLLQVAWAVNEPRIDQQIFEIEFEPEYDVSLSHHITIGGGDEWMGTVILVYPFGTPHIFASPEEILDWEKKVRIEASGCDSTHSFDVSDEKTEVEIEVFNGTSDIDITIKMTLKGMVENIKGQSIPLIGRGGEKDRFSFVTASSNLEVNQTKVVVHLPASRVLSNYLPLHNVTVLTRGSEDEQSVFWSFDGRGAVEARVYVEFGTKGKIGRFMILILVIIILGVVLAALKLLLILDEENLTY
jgi:hypothetical protein